MALLAAGCGPHAQAISPRPSAGGWEYQVHAGEGARVLSVEASFSVGSSDELSLETGAEPYVRDVEAFVGGAWVAVPASGTSWYVPSCPRDGCRVRYRFHLADATRAMEDLDRGLSIEGAELAPPSTWLLHPLSSRTGDVSLDVTTPPGISFVTGLARVPGSTSRYTTTVEDLPMTPYSAFGELRTRAIVVAGATLDVAIAKGDFTATDDELVGWVSSSASAVAAYLGRAAVPRTQIIVTPARAHGLFGKTLGNGGASILLAFGQKTTRQELADDWVMVHEMLHLAFPSLPREQLWLEEGLATYVEPLVRAKAGIVDDRRFWRELARGLPHGLPGDDDRGLDHTHTWGRTYWGGALFCLLADVAIREETAGRHGLGDALRAILAAGGDARSRWTLSRTLAVGDAATGTKALETLYGRMADQPSPVDLPGLFRSLGVVMDGGDVSFDDAAPRAAIRRAITNRP